LSEKWKDLLAASDGKTLNLDITEWLSKATLDAIGEGMLPSTFDTQVFIHLISYSCI
jgi:hypothetical protein